MPTHKSSSPSTLLRLATIGYEGRTPDEFVAMLAENSIKVIVDVRQRAGSRKRGFAKSVLQELLAASGIEYRHFPLLGTPAQLRKRIRAGELDLQRYLREYRRHLNEQFEPLKALEDLVAQKRCCLLCVEADPLECHRSILAQVLARRSRGKVELVHL